jgi:aspartate/methionine/tyrosine aminotransferase
MRIERFVMERTQCLYENEVEFNLSESGVHPPQVGEILQGASAPEGLGAVRLGYPPSNGSEELRSRIGRFYGGAPADEVMVTNGGSEANYVVCWGLLQKGDRAAVMIPNYLQTRGLARAYGDGADPFSLVERREQGRSRWALDVDGLRRAVTRRTRLIVVTHPNNPTGGVLSEAEMDEVVRAARRVGAWILSDEVYRGAELAGPITPSFRGRYERTLITAGLSKAFGLPGLRIGWIVGPAAMIRKLCHYHDYLTLTPTMLSERLARVVMEPARRDALLERTRGILRAQLPIIDRWVGRHDGVLSYIPPLAGAIALVRYRLPIGSEALFNRLRLERSVLITPGAHFGIGRYIRVGFGGEPERLQAGLERIDSLLATLERGARSRRGRAHRAAARRSRRPAEGRSRRTAAVVR